MKLSSLVLISAATAGRIDKCNNIISFLETQGISAENRVHRRIQEFKEVLYPIVKDRAQFCGTEDVNERVEMEELDEVEQRMTFDNVDNKIQVCFDLWDEYINRKLPADACPNLNSKANRKLRKFTDQLQRGAEKAQLRANGLFRSGRRPKLTAEEKAVRDENREAKQARKAEKQERKQTRLSVKEANEAERKLKQDKKKKSQDKKQASQDKKAEKQAKKNDKASKPKKIKKTSKEEPVVEEPVAEEPVIDGVLVEAVVVDDVVENDVVEEEAADEEPIAYEYVYDGAASSSVEETAAEAATEEAATEEVAVAEEEDESSEDGKKKKKFGGKKKGKKTKEE